MGIGELDVGMCVASALFEENSMWWALSREATLVMPVVSTSREDTFRGGEVLTSRVVMLTQEVL